MSKAIKYNKSKTYLLPLLSELLPLRIDYMNFLENTFMFDDEEKYKDCIFILHDFSFKNPEFTAYEHRLTNSEYFIDLIDIDNQVLYIFKFPEEYMHEYNSFQQGKYSAFGVDAKNLILDFWSEVYSNNASAVPFLLKVKQILFKDKRLKEQIEKDLKVTLDDDAELGDIITIEHETFDLKQYKKKNEDKIKKIIR